MPFNRTWSVERLREFARSQARRDRRERKPWVSDTDLEASFAGYAKCVAVVSGQTITLTRHDMSSGIAAYRRIRAVRKPNAGAQRILITVVGDAA
jgi:hypothetical protein